MKNLVGAGLSPEALARTIVDRLRRLVVEIRHGRREATLALVALACFAVPSLTGYLPLPQDVLDHRYFGRSFYAAGGLLLVWVFVRIWRQATPVAASGTGVSVKASEAVV
jgi:hypothetical protein